MLAPGTYRLAADLVNPKADRRQRYDWRAKAVFTAGTEFVVVADTVGETAGVDPSGWTVIRMVGARYTYQAALSSGPFAELYAALEGALQPVAESVAACLFRLEVNDHFAAWLLDSGVVTRELFERLWLLYCEDSTDSATAIRLVERP